MGADGPLLESGQCGADANDILISSFALASLEAFPFIMFGGEMMRSYSTGTVRIRSADPRQHPEIDLRMLSSRRDLERMKTMLALTRELVAGSATTYVAARSAAAGPAHLGRDT